jgi:hypothetical protein
MDFTWCSLGHIFKNPSNDDYVFVTERTYREWLSGDDLVEFDKDLAEIDAFEAELFARGDLVLSDILYEDLTFPNGTTANPNGNDQITGYHLIFKAAGPEEPNHLIHPAYFKWFDRLKVNPNLVTKRESFWVK